MDFDQAIRAHSEWKIKLQGYLKKPDKSLKASDIEVDNKCPLGQWIYGEGHKHAALPEYTTLKAEHAKFHKAAAAVVRKADSGQSTTEETALGSNSEFGSSSSSVVSAIMKMKLKAAS
ncbi:MAG: CZB domain-containing protein [Deltaproteobacteria bacterium]|nr:MAG: CZB domain-containing protein [Deltaproteobacteria bacterium]